MPTVLDPFQFVLIAVAGWMNQRQLQMIEYLREENRVFREQLGERRLRLTDAQRDARAKLAAFVREVTDLPAAVGVPEPGPYQPTAMAAIARPYHGAGLTSKPPAIALRVRDALGGTLVELGSAGAKVASVVQGLSDVYVHAGGQFEWDSAAPVAVARAAGLHTSRIDGSALAYNQPDPRLPDLVVCRPELAEAVLAATG